MKKRFFGLFFILFLMQAPSYAETMSGGVVFDYEKLQNPEIEKIKNELPSLEKNFIELNYNLNFSSNEFLNADEFRVKKQVKAPVLYAPNLNAVPDNYEISFSTGKATGRNINQDEIKALLRKHPNNKDVLFAYAIQLKNENSYEEALDIANRISEADPDFILAHFLKGDILRKKGLYKEAVEEYIYTTQLNPYCADAYYNIARILELIDDKELALDYYKTAYQINPNDNEIRDIILEHYIDL